MVCVSAFSPLAGFSRRRRRSSVVRCRPRFLFAGEHHPFFFFRFSSVCYLFQIFFVASRVALRLSWPCPFSFLLCSLVLFFSSLLLVVSVASAAAFPCCVQCITSVETTHLPSATNPTGAFFDFHTPAVAAAAAGTFCAHSDIAFGWMHRCSFRHSP